MHTLIDLVAKAAENFGVRPAIILRAGLRDTVWSYTRLWQAVNAVARHMSDKGIEPGDRVLLMAPNSPQYVATLLGTMLSGAIPVPLDLASTESFIRKIADDTEAGVIITDRLLETIGLPRYSFADLSFDSQSPYSGPLPQAGDVAEIIYTSGTTGNPKGVMLTHGNIVANIRSATAMVPPNRDWRLLSLLPLSHMFEQTVGLFGPLLHGATLHYGVSRQSAAIRRAMKRYRINVMVVVPQLLSHMLQGLEREARRSNRASMWENAHRLAPHLPMPLRRLLFRRVHKQLGRALDVVLCGGAYLPPETETAWERLGIGVIQGYGASECAPLVACATPERRRPGSVGRPAPGVRARIAEDGEIQVTGGNVFRGYWRNDAATAAVFTEDGWYRTGDLGELDSEGSLTVRGRKNDMVVLPSGMNVFLEDIEYVLNQQPGIRGSVVVDVPRPNGETGFTAVVLAEPGTTGPDFVEAAVKSANARLASHQRVTGVRLWDREELPRTSIGKLKRHEVRAWLDNTADETAVPIAPGMPEKSVSQLQRLLSELSGVEAATVTPENDLTLDLGLGSLARVELALLLEETFNVLIEDGDLAGVEKVSQLAALIDRGGSTAPGEEIPVWPLKAGPGFVRRVLQQVLVFPVHRLVARPFHVEGLERIRGLELPALFIANHSSHVDTVSIIRALPAAIRRRLAVAAAADYFFRIPVVGPTTSLLLNTFPFSREGAVRTSLEHCGFLADQGWSVLIYPEGMRSASGKLLPFKLGIGLLATQLRVPVVPIAVFGGRDVLPKGRALPKPAPLSVRFGAALRFNEHDDPSMTAAELQRRVSELMVAPPPR